jgi:tRNA-Thr(GGU) m(6)t(6)A37 methyltransferase TsaA
MTLSRRNLLGTTITLAAAGCLLPEPGGTMIAEEKPGERRAEEPYELVPVGWVEKEAGAARIRILEPYSGALLGLEEWSHIQVLYWFHRNDVPERRAVLRVHPRGDRDNPLTGVFACRSPVRPNLIALSVCRILSIENGLIELEDIDAFDGTPVLDIKPLLPSELRAEELRVPDWMKR